MRTLCVQRMDTDLDTVTGSPEKGGTDKLRNAAATQLPVGVPLNGAPFTTARVARPDGANVTLTRATPLGSPAALHPLADPAAPLSAALAAALLNSGPAGGGGLFPAAAIASASDCALDGPLGGSGSGAFAVASGSEGFPCVAGLSDVAGLSGVSFVALPFPGVGAGFVNDAGSF